MLIRANSDLRHEEVGDGKIDVMYKSHPSQRLTDLFAARPFQGVSPDRANFLFVGLDANYSKTIESDPVFPKILEYHEDGEKFWQTYGVHHPFLLPGYTVNGKGKFAGRRPSQQGRPTTP